MKQPTEWGWMDAHGEIEPWTGEDERSMRLGLLKGMVLVEAIYVIISGLGFGIWAAVKMIGGMQ